MKTRFITRKAANLFDPAGGGGVLQEWGSEGQSKTLKQLVKRLGCGAQTLSAWPLNAISTRDCKTKGDDEHDWRRRMVGGGGGRGEGGGGGGGRLVVRRNGGRGVSTWSWEMRWSFSCS